MSRMRSLCVLLCAALAAACSDGVGPNEALVGPWSALTAGQDHTCGLTSTGVAYCWGSNYYYGQLGVGSWDTLAHPRPLAVSGALTFATLAAGSGRTCGVTRGGTTYCWGAGGQWQWPFTGAYSTTPIAVPIGLTFTTLALPGCGLTSAGAAYCWASGYKGALTLTQIVGVNGEETFTALAGGYGHTCSVASTGAAYCWGGNESGQLGSGDTLAATTPVAVAGGLTFATLAAGGSHTCGVTSAGAAYCWGSNEIGQLGDGSLTLSLTPLAVAGGLTFTTLAAGYSHTCGLTSGGAAYCWGSNWYGELGYSTTTYYSTTPKAVAGGLAFVGLAAGGAQTCGVTGRGAAYCWGGNGSGQLGDGTTTDRATPVRVLNP